MFCAVAFLAEAKSDSSRTEYEKRTGIEFPRRDEGSEGFAMGTWPGGHPHSAADQTQSKLIRLNPAKIFV